jgi:hypothetical protein
MSRPLRNWVSNAPEVLFRVLNASEAKREFGLHSEQIYAAVERGEVHAVAMPPRDDRSGRGQTRYPEWELSKLAERLGLTAARFLENDEEPESRLS